MFFDHTVVERGDARLSECLQDNHVAFVGADHQEHLHDVLVLANHQLRVLVVAPLLEQLGGGQRTEGLGFVVGGTVWDDKADLLDFVV